MFSANWEGGMSVKSLCFDEDLNPIYPGYSPFSDNISHRPEKSIIPPAA